MTERVIFVADDGEEFDTREECIEYERHMTDLHGILCFDVEYGFLDPKEIGVDDAFCRAFYIAVYNAAEAIKTFEVMGPRTGTKTPLGDIHDGDIFEYVPDVWVNMTKEMSDLSRRLTAIMSAISNTDHVGEVVLCTNTRSSTTSR